MSDLAAATKPRVRLMLTCLCDAFFGEVGISTVKVLEQAGCEVVFDRDQTCCGQPPFNAGDWDAARTVATYAKEKLLKGGDPVVTPSGSCAAMLREGYPMIFPGMEHPRAFELGEFLVREMGIERWPGQLNKKVAFHRACHGRGLGLGDLQERLLGSIDGIELIPFAQAEQCCGFGGAFSATFGATSAGIGMEKLHNITESGATVIASGDMGCLMQLGGLIKRHKLPLETVHYSQLLAEAVSQ